MRICARITENFTVDVIFNNAPTNGRQLSALYYSIIRAMKEHHNAAFLLAMDKFISEEIDEMTGDDEND